MRIIRPVKVTKDSSFSRASTGTYYDKTGTLRTAVANALRISYDPSDLTKAPFAMAEPAATNLAVQSENLGVAPWANNGATFTSNYGVAPDGTTTTTLLLSNGTRYLPGVTVTSGKTYTYSFFTRSQGATTVNVYWDGTTSQGIVFTFPTESFVGNPPASRAGYKKLPNGMYRVWMTFTATTTYVNLHAYPGDGPVECWGFQLIEGTDPGSYIKTTGAAVTRAADVVTGTGLVYSNIPENDYPAWSATKVYTTGDYILDVTNHKLYQSVQGVSGTATFTAASVGNVTMKKADGSVYVPAVNTPVVFTGTPPTGITSGTTYYVQAVTATAFSVSATVGGAAITTGAQATAMTAVASNNLNVPFPNVSYWLDAGYDNRWDMFDDSITSQTTATGDLQIVFYPGTRLDSIVGFNLAANTMKIAFTDITTNQVLYSASANLIANSGIQDFYAYLYEPIVQATECLFDGIPLGFSATSLITVTFSSTGTTKVGGVVFGLSKDIGYTEWGAKVGIIDYSVKTRDTFGNYTITPRAFSKRGDFTVQVPTGQVDTLQSLLAQYRSTPIVYIGSNSGNVTKFNSTMIYGFYKDFDINIAYNAFSVCSMTIEGLT